MRRNSTSYRGKKILTHLLILMVVAFLPAICHGQKTVFNVIQSEIVKKKALFVQQQFDVADGYLKSQTTATFGLGSDWQIGLNLFDVSYALRPGERRFYKETDEPGHNADLLLNLQKGFNLNDVLTLAFGGRGGVNHFQSKGEARFVGMAYSTLQATLSPTQVKIVGGPYIGNYGFLGDGDKIGGMVGAEIPLLPKTLGFQAEIIGGPNEQAQFVIGPEVYFKNWILTAGAVLPFPGSKDPYGFTIQFGRD